MGNRDAYGPAPDISAGKDEASEKFLVFTGGLAGLVQRHANHFIAGADCPVPRAVLKGEDVSVILPRKMISFVLSYMRDVI